MNFFSEVDENVAYDSAEAIDRDAEDKYFEEEDESDLDTDLQDMA